VEKYTPQPKTTRKGAIVMKVIGKHLTVDMYGCSFDVLDDLDFVKNAMLTAVEEAKMTLLEFSYHKFEPQGLTALALLAESHMSIHTYPELGYAAIDVFTCGDQSRPDKAVAVLKRFLKPEKTKTTNIKRGDFGSESDMKPKTKIRIAPIRRVKNTGAKMLNFLSRAK
jgi:S-adenosylmethionine decarboxylase